MRPPLFEMKPFIGFSRIICAKISLPQHERTGLKQDDFGVRQNRPACIELFPERGNVLIFREQLYSAVLCSMLFSGVNVILKSNCYFLFYYITMYGFAMVLDDHAPVQMSGDEKR